MKLLRQAIMQTFGCREQHPQEESKTDSDPEEDNRKNSVEIYDAIGSLLQNYLSREVDLEKEVNSINEVVQKTEEQMQKAKECLEVLQNTLQGVKFTGTTAPTEIMSLTTEFMDNDTSFTQVYSQLIEEKR